MLYASVLTAIVALLGSPAQANVSQQSVETTVGGERTLLRINSAYTAAAMTGALNSVSYCDGTGNNCADLKQEMHYGVFLTAEEQISPNTTAGAFFGLGSQRYAPDYSVRSTGSLVRRSSNSFVVGPIGTYYFSGVERSSFLLRGGMLFDFGGTKLESEDGAFREETSGDKLLANAALGYQWMITRNVTFVPGLGIQGRIAGKREDTMFSPGDAVVYPTILLDLGVSF